MQRSTRKNDAEVTMKDDAIDSEDDTNVITEDVEVNPVEDDYVLE